MNKPSIIQAETINITVKTAYIPEHSDQEEPRFVFSYTITITNNGKDNVQLLSRYWLITDANGETSTVSGEGVIGKQPSIAPNKSFTYSSGCLLKTPIGTMQGHYQFLSHDNNLVQADIPVFRLAQPNILH